MNTLLTQAAPKPAGEYTPKEGRDEMNIAEFPIALLSDRAPRDTKTLEFQDTIRDHHSGQPVTRKLVVQGTERLGLPTAKDDEVLLGLIQLTRQKNNFSQRKIQFSRYELLRLIEWRDEGKNYHRLDESLHRWASVYLSYEKAWWDNRRKSWVDEGFHILERVSLYERDHHTSGGKQSHLQLSSFTWNEVFFRSCEDGYLKALDLGFLLWLDSSVARRMYRFLDKHFYHRQRLEYDLEVFAFEHVGLNRDYHTGKIKEKLQAAIKELEDKEFLEPLPATERYIRVRRGEWKVVFKKKLTPRVEQKVELEPAGLPPQAEALILRGVTPATASQLAASFSTEHLARHVEIFDWLLENKDPRLSKNPAGYLVESIRKDYQPPAGFESKADRQRKQQASEEKRRKAREDQAQARKENKRQKALGEEISQAWQNLPEEERERIRQEIGKQNPVIAGHDSFIMTIWFNERAKTSGMPSSAGPQKR